MSIEKSTFEVLKNFAAINQNIIIEPGSSLKTATQTMTVFASTTVSDEFPVEIRLYDLNEFLGVVSLMGGPENCDFEWSEKKVILRNPSSKSKTTYWFASKDVLRFPEKTIKMPDPQLSIETTVGDLETLKRAATTFKHPAISFYLDGSKVMGRVFDPEVKTSNQFELEINEIGKDSEIESFDVIIAVANMRYVNFPGLDSAATIELNMVKKDKAMIIQITDGNLQYFVGVDTASSFVLK